MNRLLIAILLIFAVLLSGCVSQYTAQPTTATTQSSSTQPAENPEYSHDLDQALNDLNQLG